MSDIITTRPRLWLTPERESLLRQRIAVSDPRWVNVVGQAKNDISAPPSIDLAPNRVIAGYFAGDDRFRQRALDEALRKAGQGLSAISADSYFYARSVLPQVAMVYDWLHDWMQPADRQTLQTALETWADAIWLETNPVRANGWAVRAPGDNYFHGFMMTWMVGLALWGDSPKAQGYLDHALARWHVVVTPYLYDRAAGGYWPEGSQYGTGTMMRMLLYLLAHQTATGEDLTANDWFNDVRAMELRMTSPDMAHDAPFADQASSPGGRLDQYDRMVGLLLGNRWWLDTVSPVRCIQNNAWAEFLFYPYDKPSFDYRTTLSLSGSARGAGYVTSRTSWVKDAIQFHLRCGARGGNHEDNGAGELAIIRGGDWLLAPAALWSDSGTTGSGTTGAKWTNCLTVDDRGQDPQQTSAKIVAYDDQPTHTYVLCDGTHAYDYTLARVRKQPLSLWQRQVVFLKDSGTLILRDVVQKTNPASVVKLHLNTKSIPLYNTRGVMDVTLGASQMEVAIVQGSSPLMVGAGLGPGGAVSSTRTEITGDTLLLVFQCGPTGFQPQTVTPTGLGVEVGDTEVRFLADGTVKLVDHSVDPVEQALISLRNAVNTWYNADLDVHQKDIPAVVEAAKQLIQVTG